MAQPSDQASNTTIDGTGAANAPETATQPLPAKQSFRELLLSLLAGAIGVQSSANREKDFQKGRAVTYIIAGSIGTLLFITGLVSLVQFILKNAS